MLATAASRPFGRPGWIFELKYDGFRVLAVSESARVRLLTRRGNDLEILLGYLAARPKPQPERDVHIPVWPAR
jgi:bifunctional non-homologous end joining protein LigD